MDHVQALWDIEQIKRLKARYFRLQDQDRWDEWGELFTEDCEVVHPHDVDPVTRGRAAIVERTSTIVGGAGNDTLRRAHRGTNPDIEILDERTARGTWALHCIVTFGDEADPRYTVIYGYYHDEYRKDPDGQWRIHRMRYDNDVTARGSGAPQIRL
jgi:hypothetical protein